jgi:hypothetical protein
LKNDSNAIPALVHIGREVLDKIADLPPIPACIGLSPAKNRFSFSLLRHVMRIEI